MKKLFFFLATCYFPVMMFSQSVAINNDGSPPHSSAMLDVKNPNKGILIPRTSTSTRLSIPGVKGLAVYDTTTNSFWFHNGSNWNELASGGMLWSGNGTHIFNNNTGNVGIGTNTPGYDLHIYRPNPSIGFTDVDDNHSSGYITGDSTNLEINAYRKPISGSNEPGNLILQVGSSGFPNYSAGNVGIGKSDPYYKLSLNGDFGLYSGNTLYGIIQNSSDDLSINAKLGNTLVQTPAQNLILQYENSQFSSSGRVGIGTNAPTGKLHVLGSGELFRAGSTTTAIHMTQDFIQFISSSVGKYYMQLVGNNLSIGNSTGNNSGNLFIYGNQIGIGTNNPATGYKVSIAGKAICEELKVQLTGSWPDYVFKKDYKLKSLNDLSKYIAQNQRLPNIPSAKEIESSGIEIGDMQRRMMEKIEELTLYILELHKEIGILKVNTAKK